MKCPHCEELLVISERQGIEIDYCPKCRGVWLDKGELDKIIERSELHAPGNYDKNKNQDDFDDDYDNRSHYDDTYKNRKKRGGFLSNLFDFD